LALNTKIDKIFFGHLRPFGIKNSKKEFLDKIEKYSFEFVTYNLKLNYNLKV
jgi:hypothetical protein